MNKRTLLIIALMIQAPFAGAEALSSATFTLQQALRIAHEKNPELRAARKKWEAARAGVGAERAWEKPRVTYERMYSGDEKLYGVAQEIPFPGKLRLKGGVASKQAVVAEQEYRARENDVQSRVISAYAMYYLAVKSIGIFEENVELMRRFARASEAKYAVGKASQADVLRAQVELSKMLNMLVTLNQEKETAQAMLNTLLSLPPQNPMGPPHELPVRAVEQSLEELQQTALAHRPELLASEAALERSRKALTSSKLEYLPDIMAEFRTRQAMNPEMDNTQDVAVGLTVPLWFWKQRAMVRMASAEKEMNEAEYESMRNMTLFAVKDLLVKTQTSQRMVELYRTSVIPQAEQALKITESSYRSDRAGFTELIDVQRTLLQLRIEHYQHLADYEQRVAELERTVGRNLWEARP